MVARFSDDELPDPNAKAPPPPRPARWKAWDELVQVAPLLKRLERPSTNEQPPPKPMSDFMLLAFAALLTDPARREALNAILFDLLADDIRAMIVGILTEDVDDAPKTSP